jgi:hypothetical protein
MGNINEYKKRFYNLMESTLGDAKPLISEQADVSDLERKELGDKMMKDWIDLHYIHSVFNKEKNKPYAAFNNNGKLDYNMAYREHMERIDDDLKDLGFPNGFRIPEGITRDEFEGLKKRWDDTIKIEQRRANQQEVDKEYESPKNDCFSNTTISVPSSCKAKTTGGMIGTGISVSQECISDLGAMMTMKNLTEVTKVLMCISKKSLFTPSNVFDVIQQ